MVTNPRWRGGAATFWIFGIAQWEAVMEMMMVNSLRSMHVQELQNKWRRKLHT